MADRTVELSLVKERLAHYLIAEQKILRNQEYTFKDRTFRKADLKEVRKAIQDMQFNIVRLERGGIPSRLVIPRTY